MFEDVRTIVEGDKVLFCASDVAKALGYSNERDAVSRHCKGVVKRDTSATPFGHQMSFIPEGDVYRLIVHSNLPAAEKFESWVMDEVLPSIRKHGAYMTDITLDKILNDAQSPQNTWQLQFFLCQAALVMITYSKVPQNTVPFQQHQIPA